MANFWNKALGFKAGENSFRTELVAGLTTFLTMAYILAVNPNIFGALDMPRGSVFTATALAALVGTLVMALYAKKPFALAPGMGLNAFFVFTVCLTMGHSWQFALTAVFIEGIIFIILTLTKVRSWILNAIPLSLKHAIGAGIGLFIAFSSRIPPPVPLSPVSTAWSPCPTASAPSSANSSGAAFSAGICLLLSSPSCSSICSIPWEPSSVYPRRPAW